MCPRVAVTANAPQKPRERERVSESKREVGSTDRTTKEEEAVHDRASIALSRCYVGDRNFANIYRARVALAPKLSRVYVAKNVRQWSAVPRERGKYPEISPGLARYGPRAEFESEIGS